MGQEERRQEGQSSRRLAADKNRGESWNARKVRRWDRTKLSQRMDGLLVRMGVTTSGGRWKQCARQPFPVQASCKGVERWCSSPSLPVLCPHAIGNFALIIWMRSEGPSRQNKGCWGQIAKCTQLEGRGFWWKVSQLLRLNWGKGCLWCTAMWTEISVSHLTS